MMTAIEIKKMFELLKEVDGGCSVCVRRAIVSFCESFPEHRQKMIELVKTDDCLDWADYEDEI